MSALRVVGDCPRGLPAERRSVLHFPVPDGKSPAFCAHGSNQFPCTRSIELDIVLAAEREQFRTSFVSEREGNVRGVDPVSDWCGSLGSAEQHEIQQ